MSAKIMGQVWELDLPFNKLWVLLALADHADHQGNNVFPSLPLVAWKTGYSLDNIKKIVPALKKDGILVEYGQTRFGVKIYRIELSHVPRKPDFVEPEIGRPKGSFDKVPRKTQCKIDTPFSGTHNRQVPINTESRGSTEKPHQPENAYLPVTREHNQDFPDDFDPFGDFA